MAPTIALITAAWLAAAPDTAACGARIERELAAMGTVLRVRLCAQDDARALAASEAVFREVQRLNGVLSSWTERSEVGRINSAAGGAALTVTPELFGLLRETGEWVEATGGAFDPAIGALVDAWQLRHKPRVPTPAEQSKALERSGWRHLRLGPASRVQRGPAGWWLDTGGFGKGAALRRAAAVLQDADVSSAEIDFGGQLLVVGEERVIAVADPANRQLPVAHLRVRDMSVSTSSQSERSGHILDPRTGKPVPAWGSVSVVTRDAMTADILSTALFVMGPQAAMEWARTRTDVGVLILENTTTQPRATWNEPLARMIMETTR